MSKIEWTDITRNPVKGKCPVACPYCYAREIYDKNKWDPEIRLRMDVLDDLPKKPCRVFVGSTMELLLFPKYLPGIFDKCRQHPEHTFIFLTKQAEELPKWSPFPDNCEIGVSAPNYTAASNARYYLKKVQAKVKYLSIEPLLSPLHDRLNCTLNLRYEGINWLIIGAMTGQRGRLLQLQEEQYPQLRLEKLNAVGRKWTLLPRLEWVKEIVVAANDAGIPLFLKENIYKLAMDRPAEDHDLYFEDMSTLRQELPGRRVMV